VLSACGIQDPKDVSDDFPHKKGMNISYAQGGSSIIAPLGIPLVEPTFGSKILYAELEAWMPKAVSAFVDTVGHYGRPDVFKLLIRQDEWREAGSRGARVTAALADQLKRSAEKHDVDERKVISAVERMAQAAE